MVWKNDFINTRINKYLDVAKDYPIPKEEDRPESPKPKP